MKRVECVLYYIFRTANDPFVTPDTMATAGVDYEIVSSGVVIMRDQETAVDVPITILPVRANVQCVQC